MLRRPSWTPSWISPLLPVIQTVHPSFFYSPRWVLQGSRVKMRGHLIAHRTPLSPRTMRERAVPCYEQDWMFAKRSRNASVDGASTISSSRWFQSIIVLTKNECLYGSLLYISHLAKSRIVRRLPIVATTVQFITSTTGSIARKFIQFKSAILALHDEQDIIQSANKKDKATPNFHDSNARTMADVRLT